MVFLNKVPSGCAARSYQTLLYCHYISGKSLRDPAKDEVIQSSPISRSKNLNLLKKIFFNKKHMWHK